MNLKGMSVEVAADGGVPVFSRVLDGGAGEVAQVVDAIKHSGRWRASTGF
ncbi:hypothetical protein ACWD4L_49725 [Streptomyces sp. NPDC002596]